MRRHFHRCMHLRVIGLDASELGGARRGGGPVLDELCDAKKLAPCIGLAECDVLDARQKRDLLVARATRLREEEGGVSPLGDVPAPRAAELAELREALLEEREEIVEENRRVAAEMGGALRRNPRPAGATELGELDVYGMSVRGGEDLRGLRTERLDAIDRALDAMARAAYGACAFCGAAIALERLRDAPDARSCARCARAS